MANDCQNIVVIKHSDPSMIARIVESFNSEDVEYNLLDAMCGSRYEFSDAQVRELSVLEQLDTELNLSFETDWAPPISAYKIAEAMGYTISASYCDFCAPFCGTYSEGVEQYYVWDSDEETPDDLRERIPEDLLEEFSIIEYVYDEEDMQ